MEGVTQELCYENCVRAIHLHSALSEIVSLLFFFPLVQSQIAVWSPKRMRLLCMRTAHGIYESCRREKLARISRFLGR